MDPDDPLPPVYVVDDDASDRVLALRALQRAGVRNPVRAFADGAEFVEFVNALDSDVDEPPCAVFVDLRMPAMDGFELVGWIRSRRRWDNTQVVILTGSVDPKDMRRAAELRADFYLPKFPSDETLARVMAKATAGALQARRLASR